MSEILYVFFCSMLPIIELRGAIPLGIVAQLPWYFNYIICVVGNLLPIPFILIFIRAILKWMKQTRRLSGIANWLEEKADKNSAKIRRYEALGLFIFVAIPIPGTGAWTGALIAALLKMRLKVSLPTIALGVMTAGVIMILAGYFLKGALGFLL